jgi:NADH-quinone oxidoreductase subunit C
VISIWVETQSIQKVADALYHDPECRLDWLENLSVVEFEGIFVVSYFLRSTVSKHTAIIRLSTPPVSGDQEIQLPSIQNTWPMGIPMEQEAYEMFGVQFQVGHELSEFTARIQRLPEGWEGFPLRKNYVFPKSFHGIPHLQPSHNRINQKKSPQ